MSIKQSMFHISPFASRPIRANAVKGNFALFTQSKGGRKTSEMPKNSVKLYW